MTTISDIKNQIKFKVPSIKAENKTFKKLNLGIAKKFLFQNIVNQMICNPNSKINLINIC